MRTAIVVGASIIALTAGVAAHADQRKEDQKFCADVAAFESDVAQLNAIGQQSTVAELRAANDRVVNDAANMQKIAHKMKTPTAKQFTEAMKQLQHDVNAIPDNATLEQVRAKINADIRNAQNTGRQLAGESGCPAPQQP
jgi:hypothetical protein